MSRGPAAQLFLDALRDHLAHRLTQTADLGTSWQERLRAHYQASAIIGALTWWLEHDQPQPAVDVADLVETLGQ